MGCRDARGTVHAAPVANLDVVAQFFERRNFDAFEPGARGHRKGLHFAGVDVLGKLAVAAAAHSDITTQNCRSSLTTAPKSHVVDLGRIHTHLTRNHGRGNVLGRAARAATPLDTTRVFFQLLDHILHGLEGGVGWQHKHVVFAGEADQRRGRAQGYRRFAGDDAAKHDRAHDHDGVWVALAGIDKLGQAQGARRPTLVLVADSVSRLGFEQGSAQGAASAVPTAAGVGRDHHFDVAASQCRQRQARCCSADSQ